MSTSTDEPDGPARQHDVVVLGTGAAGLAAALAAHDQGASVGVYEKGSHIGGTTAISGGLVWIPANPHMAEVGIADTVEDAFAYLMSLSHGLIDPELARAFVTTGPATVTWLESATPLRFHVVEGFPDYQPEHPGGKPGGGRALECELFPFNSLGPWADRVIRPGRPVHMLLHETPIGGGDGTVDPAMLAERVASDARGIGQAIVGGLLMACVDRGIEPVTNARAVRLIEVDERVVAVELERAEGRRERVAAARGIVLATGGFEWDGGLVCDFLRGPMTAPMGVPTNTGDGLRMAMRLGARLGNMREAWWVPVMEVPDPDGTDPRRVLLLRERTLPRSIMVNRSGVRFVNEAANYNALGGAFHQFDAGSFDYPNLPAWLVFDHEFWRRYGLAGLEPSGGTPEWLTSADTLDQLARRLGVDAEGLVRTVSEFNADVAAGRDSRFHRGDSTYDHWSGDRARHGRGSTLGALDEPPFHALEVLSGCLGTSGGPRTDADGRVLDVDGQPIAGLFAAGNVMSAATGMTYGGPGGTLGPALTFGYRAGRAVARAENPPGADGRAGAPIAATPSI